jgi:hypothetical protein
MRQNLFGHCAAKNLITKYRVSGWSDPKTKIVQCKQQMVSGQAKLLWICFDKGKIQSYQNHDRHPRYVCQQWTHDSPKIVTNVNILLAGSQSSKFACYMSHSSLLPVPSKYLPDMARVMMIQHPPAHQLPNPTHSGFWMSTGWVVWV